MYRDRAIRRAHRCHADVTSLPWGTIPGGLRIDATFRVGTIEGSSVERWKFSGPAFQLLNETGTVEATRAPA